MESEDSENLNTSFVERLNLTIRQGSAYLRRHSPCHARCADRLRWHVELLRCHYNFVRPHSALKFGRETRTPAMQAGLVSTRMKWSDIFTARGLSLRFCDGRAHSASRPAHRNWRSRAADVLMAARSEKGCLINSEWRKHPVKLHRTSITTKLRVQSVAELTRLVQEAGFFDDGSIASDRSASLDRSTLRTD